MWVFDNALNTICCSFNDIHASAGGQESTILLESLARVSGTNIPSDYLSKEQVHIDICLGIYNLLGQDKKARQWARCEGRGLEWRTSPRGAKQDTLACARQDWRRNVRLFLPRTNRRAICARAERSRVENARPILELRAAPPQTAAKEPIHIILDSDAWSEATHHHHTLKKPTPATTSAVLWLRDSPCIICRSFNDIQ